MITKLPKWIETSAFVFAFCAGCINVVGLLGFNHQAVSHVSGTATLLGAAIIDSTLLSPAYLSAILVSFLSGAALAGFLLRGRALQLDRHYETALVIEAALIFIAFLLMSAGSFYGLLAASAACGLQNALATTFSAGTVRTTHLTGIVTDLGMMCGAVLKGQPFDTRKAILLLLIVAGFISGGVIGTVLFKVIVFNTLLLPALLCVGLAVGFRRHRRAVSL